MGFYKELGDRLEQWLKEKIKVVDTKVESIAKYQKYVNTELDYGTFTLATNITSFSVGVKLLLQKINGSIELNDEGNIVLLSNKTYKITLSCVSDGRVDIAFCNANTGEEICNSIVTDGTLSASSSFIYHADDNISIYPHICYVENAKTIWKAHTHIVIQEINRQITIDPVEHVNESHGIEDTPVGHIISHMGTTAPKHYLICDGAEYNITDYPYLAQHIQDNFGTVNFFGGDGTTTFAVPDLRGEFLRGTGTATRDTGSGAEVGVHQNGTNHLYSVQYGNSGNNGITQFVGYSNASNSHNNYDKITSYGNKIYNTDGNWSANKNSISKFTSRPTNTSVLYCIKYEPTYFMNTYNTNYMQPSMYSEEERIVGCWIDGKPLYQKVIETIASDAVTDGTPVITTVDISDLDIDAIAMCRQLGRSNSWTSQGVCHAQANPDALLKTYVGLNPLKLIISNSCINYNSIDVTVILQYTKTTDEENSFTNDMLKDSYVELTYTDEEIYNEVASILSSESNKGE